MAHRAGEVVLRSEDDGHVICDRCILADTLRRHGGGAGVCILASMPIVTRELA